MILFKELLLLYLLKNTETIDGRHAKKSEQLYIIPKMFWKLEMLVF